jgi:hypothetical protein
MKRDTFTTIKSTFLSCERDAEAIIKKLFVENKPHSNTLKKLLIINTKDCLDDSNQSYNKIVENTTVKELIEEKYFSTVPLIKMKEHEDLKSYIVLTFDDFVETSNPEYRDCMVYFDIMCPQEYWDLGDYRLRPLKIAGIIDGILHNQKFSGIGTLQFHICKQLIVDNQLAGYTLIYRATHGSDDSIPGV